LQRTRLVRVFCCLRSKADVTTPASTIDPD
jgi:hypothetical protein